jgi:hypothetical protein
MGSPVIEQRMYGSLIGSVTIQNERTLDIRQSKKGAEAPLVQSS